MRTAGLFCCVIFSFLASCSAPPKPAEQPAQATQPPKPPDDSRLFPKANLVDTSVVDKHVWDQVFMPGGTVGRYKKGKTQYEMMVAKLASPTDAAILLLDWKKAMPDGVLVASFGGYYGTVNGRPTFVFTKNAWIAGVSGLSQKQADAEARVLAANLD